MEEVGVESQIVFGLRSTRGWESVDVRYLGRDTGSAADAPSRLFRARLEVETRFWDRSDSDLGELAVNSRLVFQPVLVDFLALRMLRETLQEWTRSREPFEVEIGAENFSLVLRTRPPVGIQNDHRQTFSVSYRSENELTRLEQIVVTDSTVVDQAVSDLASFLEVGGV